MIKVTPLINTVGTEKFIEFLNQPFNFDQLLTLFCGWKYDKMVDWVNYTNEDGIVLEVHQEHYILINGNLYIGVSMPKTLNDFINSMNAFGVKLFWTYWIDKNFEPKDYLHKDEIKQYYINLLESLGKSHELL